MNRAEDLEVAGRTVLVRADLNVPLAIGAGLRAMGPGGSPPGQESAPPDQHRITDDTGKIYGCLPGRAPHFQVTCVIAHERKTPQRPRNVEVVAGIPGDLQ